MILKTLNKVKDVFSILLFLGIIKSKRRSKHMLTHGRRGRGEGMDRLNAEEKVFLKQWKFFIFYYF